MKNRSDILLPIIEKIANIGCYETNILAGTWIGSESFITLFGLDIKTTYSVEEFEALVHPEDRDWVMNYFRECINKKIDFNCEYRCVKKNGQTIFVNSRSKIYFNADGTAERILGVKEDVTQFKQNERRLNQLNDNNKKKNEILSIAAHDLKSPISQLQGLARIIKKELKPEHYELVDMQERICNSAHTIINEIVKIAELEDEAYNLTTTLVNINQLIDQVVQTFAEVSKEKSLLIRTRFNKEFSGHANAEQFSRIINNLLSNAVKFSPEARTIELHTDSNDKKFFVTIIDEGIGIKAENLPFLFDKFSKKVRRLGTKGEQSTGLGLSIVKQICSLHHGKINVESQEHKGTTFQLEFPI